MGLKDLCHICGNLASKRCRMCGRPTCDTHLKGGICESCEAGKQIGKSKTQ